MTTAAPAAGPRKSNTKAAPSRAAVTASSRGGRPAPTARPSRRAGSRRCMTMGRTARDAAPAAIKARAAEPGPGRPARAAARKPTLKTRASTPYVPMRESRMILSLAARVRPPPKPSATSASPSSCRAPVTKAAIASATRAHASGCRPSHEAAVRPAPAARPTAAPTMGKARAAPARFLSASALSGRTGRRVRNAAARRVSRHHLPRVSETNFQALSIDATVPCIPEGCFRLSVRGGLWVIRDRGLHEIGGYTSLAPQRKSTAPP